LKRRQETSLTPALSPRRENTVASIRLDQHNWHFYSLWLHPHLNEGSAKVRPPLAGPPWVVSHVESNLIVLLITAVAASAADTRTFGGKSVDLQPVHDWKIDRKGERPLSHWKAVPGNEVSTSRAAGIVAGLKSKASRTTLWATPLKFSSGPVLDKNAPRVEVLLTQ
jgi:hypothetical protein